MPMFIVTLRTRGATRRSTGAPVARRTPCLTWATTPAYAAYWIELRIALRAPALRAKCKILADGSLRTYVEAMVMISARTASAQRRKRERLPCSHMVGPLNFLSVVRVQRAALGLSQGLVKSFLASSTGQWAVLQLQCSQARDILQEELLKRNKQNLHDRPSAALCMLNSFAEQLAFRTDLCRS